MHHLLWLVFMVTLIVKIIPLFKAVFIDHESVDLVVQKHRKGLLILMVFTSLLAMTYIPHKLDINRFQGVHHLVIKDGETGQRLEVIQEDEVNHILEDLEGVIFWKRKSALFYMGTRFTIEYYSKSGNQISSIIVNGPETVRYQAYFFQAVQGQVDYDYLEDLFDKE